MGDLDPVRGNEQSGRRPLLVISDDLFNSGTANLVVIIPFTTRSRGISTHVEVKAPEGGLRQTSYARCEDVRSIAKIRLISKMGQVTDDTMVAARYRIARILAL